MASIGYGKTSKVESLPLVAGWGGGSYTARAMARIGRLLLRGGDWDGKQVTSGSEAILFYLVAYGSMTLGAFAVITYLSTPERPVETIDDLAGLGSSHPGVAAKRKGDVFSDR